MNPGGVFENPVVDDSAINVNTPPFVGPGTPVGPTKPVGPVYPVGPVGPVPNTTLQSTLCPYGTSNQLNDSGSPKSSTLQLLSISFNFRKVV
jgi:hypothetical protein